MSERKIIIGSDPEFFLRKKSSQQLISAIPYIKGGKHDPQKLPSGAGLQSDNVAVEFATPPANTTGDFINAMKATFKETLALLPEDTELAVIPSAEFHPFELADPKAQEFGCMPDYCAWELKENDSPVHPNPQFRSCGGHIHVGCLDGDGNPTHEDAQFLLHPLGKVAMVRCMDLFHGIISTILDHSPEAIERRKLYGRAGCHRYDLPYGVEYRALSNWWTKTPYSSMLISSLTDDVVDLIVSSGLPEKLDEISPDEINSIISLIDEVGPEDIQRIINEGAVEDAKSILTKFLMDHLSDDSKFYLEECINKLKNAGSIQKEWAIGE
jgi:hypothetical protein